MAELIQVTEKMAKFIEWAKEKGRDEITRLITERIEMLGKETQRRTGFKDSDGFVWNDLLEQNDGVEQWKGGGDCNKCRRVKYCKKQCRANRYLKDITTKFLYDMYLMEHPEELAQEAANGLTPDDVLKMAGVDDAHVVS